MTTSIGPVDGAGTLLQWDLNNAFNHPIDTSAGVLLFNSQSSIPATFKATVAAEPSAAALLVIGCVVALVARRR